MPPMLQGREDQHRRGPGAGQGGMKKGDWVQTPGGPGVVHRVKGDKVEVEMDWTYLVEFRRDEVREVIAQGGEEGCRKQPVA